MGIEGSEETAQIAPVDYLRADDDDDLIVDGEVIDDVEDFGLGDVDDDGELILDAEMDSSAPFHGPDGQPWDDGPGPFGPTSPPANQGMVPVEHAVMQAADIRKHATLRLIQRALPRGRSQ